MGSERPALVLTMLCWWLLCCALLICYVICCAVQVVNNAVYASYVQHGG